MPQAPRSVSDSPAFNDTPSAEPEIFVEPSPEARWLVRHLGWLVAPPGGRCCRLGRALGEVVVAPFTQFSFFSFDLQTFLYEIFHQTLWSRMGHFVFMLVVNFFVMVGLAQVSLGEHPVSHELTLLAPNLGTAYAALLLFWYFCMARKSGLWAWWLVMVPVVIALCVGANAYYSATFILDPSARGFFTPTPTAFNPWLWSLASAFVIACSHIPEPRMPPRACGNAGWVSPADVFLGVGAQRTSALARGLRLLRMIAQSVWGTLDEWWASPRLMPYNFLMLMFQLGYRPAAANRLQGFVDRALASGNPALDYVGIGGATYVSMVESGSSSSSARATIKASTAS